MFTIAVWLLIGPFDLQYFPLVLNDKFQGHSHIKMFRGKCSDVTLRSVLPGNKGKRVDINKIKVVCVKKGKDIRVMVKGRGI